MGQPVNVQISATISALMGRSVLVHVHSTINCSFRGRQIRQMCDYTTETLKTGTVSNIVECLEDGFDEIYVKPYNKIRCDVCCHPTYDTVLVACKQGPMQWSAKVCGMLYSHNTIHVLVCITNGLTPLWRTPHVLCNNNRLTAMTSLSTSKRNSNRKMECKYRNLSMDKNNLRKKRTKPGSLDS